ncbi:condensation domain-containing protein [Streptomyces hundungensis]|uniref:condensation domain-containing protein n=1 Tax=Streptomyces hundungensis TaxID=1077946 RepID=UPI0033CA6C99
MTSTHGTVLPLTAGQVEIWLDAQAAGRNNAYNSAGYLDLRGPLDRRRLRAALRRLFEEAQCLRARFTDIDGEPRQHIEQLDELPLYEQDLRSSADPRGAALAWMSADLDVPFGLDDFPLMRTALLTVGDERSYFYLCVHHLLCDGFSQTVLWRRLAELYEADPEGAVPGRALPPLSELTDAESAYRESTGARRDQTFWRGRFPEPPELVTLSRRPESHGLPTGFLRVSAALSAGAARRLRDSARRADVTLPTAAVAAVAVHTQRTAGTEEVLLTLAASARMSARQRAVPGMMANYLPLRVPVRPTLTKAELLRRASRELAQVLKHQRHRVSAIRRDMGLRAEDRRPFGPFVNLLPQQASLALGPCTAEVNNLSTGLVDDLMITVVERADDGIELHLNANPDRYTAEEARAHLDQLTAFTEEFAAAADDEPIGRVGAAGDTEEAWLRTGTGPVRAADFACVVERVRAQAARRPEAIAVRRTASASPTPPSWAGPAPCRARFPAPGWSAFSRRPAPGS